MAGLSLDSTAGAISIAISAGRLVTKKEPAAAAIQDRYKALKRAIARKSAKIQLAELEEDPVSDARRSAVAKALDEHGASKSRNVITTAKELLALVKVDENARTAVDALLADVEKALIDLADVEGEDDPPADAEKEATAKAERPKPAPRSSTRDLSSQRLIPPDEPSKTELERTALPIWKRTDRFFLKVGVVFGVYLVSALVYWFFIRTPSNVPLERCRNGDRTACWGVIATEDAVTDHENVSGEPLQLLCERDDDACGCAGLAYVQAATATGEAECGLIKRASARNPKWPCTCTRYNFWRAGQQRTAHCGIPKCE